MLVFAVLWLLAAFAPAVHCNPIIDTDSALDSSTKQSPYKRNPQTLVEASRLSRRESSGRAYNRAYPDIDYISRPIRSQGGQRQHPTFHVQKHQPQSHRNRHHDIRECPSHTFFQHGLPGPGLGSYISCSGPKFPQEGGGWPSASHSVTSSTHRCTCNERRDDGATGPLRIALLRS